MTSDMTSDFTSDITSNMTSYMTSDMMSNMTSDMTSEKTSGLISEETSGRMSDMTSGMTSYHCFGTIWDHFGHFPTACSMNKVLYIQGSSQVGLYGELILVAATSAIPTSHGRSCVSLGPTVSCDILPKG